MLKFDIDSPHTYRRTLGIHGGSPANAFADLALRLLRRYLERAGAAPIADNQLRGLLVQVWEVAAERGFPAPLPPKDQGEPREMPESESLALARQVLPEGQQNGSASLLLKPVQQLFAALLLPEFKKCRLSYKEQDDAGRVSRQNPAEAAQHISGSHCVDCPYWTELTPEQGEKLLSKSWAGDVETFTSDVGLFLPEDFRSFRLFLHMNRRFGKS